MLFALSKSLTLLFVARLIQGGADGVAWVVGFALLADLYSPQERGRVMGYVMSGTSLGILVGPSIGGWLYDMGGVELPFAFVAVAAFLSALSFTVIRPEKPARREEMPSIWSLLKHPLVAGCAALTVVIASTLAMLEPVLPLFFNQKLGSTPSQIGFIFAAAAVVSVVAPMVYGPLTAKWGNRRLILLGLVLTAAWLPMLSTAGGFRSSVVLIVIQWMAVGLVITPSLAYMAEVTSIAGADAYGVGYGLYNTAWAVGLLIGPAIGGFLFDRLGFATLTLLWSPSVVAVTFLLARVRPGARLKPETATTEKQTRNLVGGGSHVSS
jgi:predicted MFS family arabinose efflux permease